MRGEPWLILPTYNEAENVREIVTAAGDVLAGPAPDGFRVLMGHDGWPDGTGRIADEMTAEREWVKVLHRNAKNGIGPAYLAGFRHALEHGAGYVMEMDSDFSHDPADLARLLAATAGGSAGGPPPRGRAGPGAGARRPPPGGGRPRGG